MVGKTKVENARFGYLRFDDWDLFRISGLGIRAFRKGFTLLELLVVMLIIAILMGLGTAGYQLARRSARESQAKAEIELLRTALEEYRVEYGAYPEVSGTFSDLPDDQMQHLVESINGTLRLTDPWGNPYHYVSTNRYLYSIWSTGQDVDNDADNIDPSRVGY